MNMWEKDSQYVHLPEICAFFFAVIENIKRIVPGAQEMKMENLWVVLTGTLHHFNQSTAYILSYLPLPHIPQYVYSTRIHLQSI